MDSQVGSVQKVNIVDRGGVVAVPPGVPLRSPAGAVMVYRSCPIPCPLPMLRDSAEVSAAINRTNREDMPGAPRGAGVSDRWAGIGQGGTPPPPPGGFEGRGDIRNTLTQLF